MKQQFILIWFTVLLTTPSLLGQQRQYDLQPLRQVTLTPRAQTELEPRVEMDTLGPPIVADDCFLNQTAFGFVDAWGAVGGMNEFEDKEKAQLINNTTNTAISITGGLVFFNQVSVVGNGDLRMKVYSVDANNGIPDLQLGVSDNIKADQIAVNDTFILTTTFPFSTPVSLEDPAFFMSVDFSDLYATGDTTDLLHTEVGCGSGAEAYERWIDDSWNSMVDVWSSDTEVFDMNFSIFAVIEFEAVSAAKDPYYQQGQLRLRPATPNPARDLVRLNYELERSSTVQVEIYSADGRRIQQRQLGLMPGGRHIEEVALSSFPAGAYIYSIVSDQARVVSRFVVE